MRTRNLADVRSDSDLAEQAAAGSAPAFDELYRRHAPAAWGLAWAVAAEGDAAGRAVGDAFVRVFQALPAGRLEDPSLFRSGLLTATRQAAIAARGRDNIDAPAGDDRLVRSADATTSAADPVVAAFASLPERWRTVLWLTQVEHVAPETVALVVGATVETTTRLAARAEAAVHERVGGDAGARPLGEVLRDAAPPLPRALAGTSATRWKLAAAAAPAATAAAAAAGGYQAPALHDKLRKPLLIASTGLFALGIIAASVVSSPDSSPGRALPTRSVPPAVTTQPAQVAPQQTITLAVAASPAPPAFDSGLRDVLAPAAAANPEDAPSAAPALDLPASPATPAPIFDTAPGSAAPADAPAPPAVLSDALIGAGLGLQIGGQDVGLAIDLGPTPGIGLTLGPLTLGEATPAVPGSSLGGAVDLSSVLLPAALPSGIAFGQ